MMTYYGGTDRVFKDKGDYYTEQLPPMANERGEMLKVFIL